MGAAEDMLIQQLLGGTEDDPEPPRIILMPPPPGAPPPPRIVLLNPRRRDPVIGTHLSTAGERTSRRVIIDDAVARGIPGYEIENLQSEGPFKDELDDYFEQKARASKGPNGEDLDDFYMRVQLREHQRDDLHKKVPFVRSGPRSAAAAILGNTVNISPNNQPQSVVYWTGDDVDTQPVTITLSVVNNLTDVSPSAVFRPYARIRFGTRAIAANVEIDVGFGTQLVLAGAQVTVEVACEDTTALSATAGSLRMSGHLSFRNSFKANAVTRTRFADSVASAAVWKLFGNNSSTVQGLGIPPFSRSLTVWRTGNLGDPFTVQFVDSNNTATAQQVVAANTLMTAMDVPGDAAGLNLTNGAAANTNSYRLVFSLSF